ncbi:N-acetylglucosaminyl deacetylase, LmbE family [Catalinimonas alkaloidigena]|uniref:N-acetylglucosaminyl deacetylase, LmbE family n=1 Tax=Catalinimonas alkaloidigena TaxID=1075417 RepID=A0A1G8XCN8_9BACT|nr:PIG-L family deacetylase [Catalinimonas alkaloidigena]SDJ88146.1 N-acetylglucosaminyl deacetylase, LmbE family [Catalinimonas alkaloidigena]
MKNFVRLYMVLCLCGPIFQTSAQAPDAASIRQQLERLNTCATVLYMAAHPDDENTAMIAWLVGERHARTGYLALTRGDGGQNLIGLELREQLGLIRTQELLAARRLDGGEQFFTRANDFGFSKSPEEAFEIWGKDQVFSDAVWVIRNFRPDIIIARFPTNGDGGHGHHTASAILAEEAYKAAADPKQFPEQLKYVKPWQVKHVYQNAWQPKDSSSVIHVDLGTYNPVLGKSYGEIAAESRSMHKSQGFGAAKLRGKRIDFLNVMAGPPLKGDVTKADPFQGVDLTWGRIKGGKAAGELVAQALRAYEPAHPEKLLPTLAAAYREVQKLQDPYWKSLKSAQLQKLMTDCAGLWLEARTPSIYVSPGDSLVVTATAINRLGAPVTWQKIAFPSNVDTSMALALPTNEVTSFTRALVVPSETPVSQPYWLEKTPTLGLYQVDDPQKIGQPESSAPFSVGMDLEIVGVPLHYDVPLRYVWVDPVQGELQRNLAVRPPVMVNLAEDVITFVNGETKPVTIRLKAGRDSLSGEARLQVPAGWTVSPAQQAYAIAQKEGEVRLTFQVSPGRSAGNSTETLRAVATTGDGRTYDRGLLTVDYPHIPVQTLFPPAEARLVKLDMQVAGRNIGYIPGAGDKIPDGLRQVGYQVTELSDAYLAEGDLSRFDAIVVGIRAYNVNDRMAYYQPRLLSYVEKGGVLVEQYNTSYGLKLPQIGPYEFTIGRRERVTKEEAPITYLNAKHPLLHYPNELTKADFDGWVQERGLYFANKWDTRYDTLLVANDPGEEPMAGGLLYTKYGKGAFVYTGYSFFRQLPAGVPGAFRLFSNLLAGGLTEPRKADEGTAETGK